MSRYARKLFFAALALSGVLVVSLVQPAAASPRVWTAALTGDSEVSIQPVSLTAAVVEREAQDSGVSFEDVATSFELPSSLGLADMDSFESLNKQISKTVYAKGSYTDLVKATLSSLALPDGQNISQAIASVRARGNLATPALSMPNVPGGAALLASAGPDELAFGLFANQALAQAVLAQPNLVSQLQQGGRLDAAGTAAFANILSSASQATTQSLSGRLISPCFAGMLAVMGAGSPSAAAGLGVPSDCSACIAAGTYLHGQMASLLGPNPLRLDPNDGVMSQYEWSQLDPSSQNAILQLNPELGRTLNQVGSNSSGASSANACSQASAGTTNFLQGRVPSILGRLGG